MSEDVLDEQGRYDPLMQKMVAAFTGDTTTWTALNRRLRDAMVHFAAARSPYYRRLEGGVAGGFERIPILTKALIRAHTDELFAEGVPEWRRIRRATSGSTGEPLVFYRDQSQGPAENQSAKRFLRWLHAIPADSRMVWITANPRLRPGPPPRPRLWDRLFGSREEEGFHGVSTVGLTPGILKRELGVWARQGPYWIYGHASIIDWVADRIETDGLERPGPPVGIVTTSDELTPLAEARIVRVFGCPVNCWYGSHEFNGYVAGTLPGTRRYAFNPLLVYAEVVDEEGRPIPPGQTGRLVLTDLNNYVFPFIRYDTGDLAAPSEEGFVGGFPVVERLEGRSSERLEFPSGRTVSGVSLGGYLMQVHDFGPLVRFYQCAQVGPNEVELRVVWARTPAEDERRALTEALRRLTDPDTAIAIRDVTELERFASGKAWIVRQLFDGRGNEVPADATPGG
jgi:phenylacetate-CoA ligase